MTWTWPPPKGGWGGKKTRILCKIPWCCSTVPSFLSIQCRRDFLTQLFCGNLLDWLRFLSSLALFSFSMEAQREKGSSSPFSWLRSDSCLTCIHSNKKIVQNTKKMDVKESKRRTILITPSGVQWDVTEQHQCVREDFSFFLWEALVHVGHIQNTVPGQRLPSFELFHKEGIDKLKRVRHKVRIFIYIYIYNSNK